MTDGLGQSSVSSTSRPKKNCYTCNIKLIDNYICSHKCDSVYFCSNKCEQDSKQHQRLCQSISDLQQQHRYKILKAGTYSTTLTVNENRAVASLIGELCLLNCYLNDQPSTLLLNSGAQVSIINIEEFVKNFPDVKIQHISSILDDYDSIRVQWGDDQDIPFEGWVP